MKIEIVYYDPRSRRVMNKTMEANGIEDWRVQAMVHKLLREGKRIRDVKVIATTEEAKTE